jgi:hypothetical protein
MIGTALLVLGAAAAYAASPGPFTGKLTFKGKAGSAKKPSPNAWTMVLKTTDPANSGQRPPIETDVKVKIYGLKVDGKDFPTCSLAKIAAAHNDNVCPKGSEIGSGFIRSQLGAATDFTQSGADCDPALHVWNGGQGKETFFFVTDASHVCLGGALKTGATAPYPGTYKQVGKFFESDTKIPKYIDFPVPGLVGSLQFESLTFSTQSKKVHGKSLISQESVGCLKGKRPYSMTTTTHGGSEGNKNVVSTISGSAPC